MKKTLTLTVLGIATLFSGCAWSTPSTGLAIAQMYKNTKTIVVKGKEIAILNSDLLDDSMLYRLNEMDEALDRIKKIEEIIVK